MKIAIFSDFFYPELSGITDSIVIQGKELARQGHTVIFVVPWYAKKDYKVINAVKNDDWGPNIIIKRLPTIGVPNSPTKQMRSPIPLGFGIYWMWKYRPDVIHTHSPIEPGYEARISAWLFNIPIVGTNHTPMDKYLNGPKWFINFVCRHYAKYYNSMALVTAPSQYLLDYMIGYGLKNKNIRALSNPIEISNFSPVKDEVEKKELKTKFGFTDKTILYTGTLTPGKHVDDVIRATALVKKEIPSITFAIAGHGIIRKELEKLTEELEVKDNVKFLGFINKQVLPAVYKASDLFVIMSTVETQSISLIQGMSAGIPVIGANSCALPEYINETNGIVVPVGDYKKLAEEIIKILSNPDLSKKLGAGGIVSANKCSTQSVIGEWIETYKKVIERKK